MTAELYINAGAWLNSWPTSDLTLSQNAMFLELVGLSHWNKKLFKAKPYKIAGRLGCSEHLVRETMSKLIELGKAKRDKAGIFKFLNIADVIRANASW